ncbi:hypothetical protein [Streptomyces triticiradicis]|uniref:hypothetical protein n=1 Tax=Streptomyces triticiradicis TaxID=2651189 RepID=UPI001CEC5131|nr:hypothetical protein [Streptomyces triticiradicis]
MSSTVKDVPATYPADLVDVDQAKLPRCIEECMPARSARSKGCSAPQLTKQANSNS